MAKGKWAKGKSPAQGGTPHKMSKPEGGKGKLGGKFAKGTKTAGKTGKGKKK